MVEFAKLWIVVNGNHGWCGAWIYIRCKSIVEFVEWEDAPIKSKSRIHLKDGTKYFSTMTVEEIMKAIKGE